MFIYIRQQELDTIIEKLTKIEEKFWLNYKYYRSEDRKESAKCFEELYKFIWSLKNTDGIQEEINYDV